MRSFTSLTNGASLFVYKTNTKTVSLGVFIAAGCVNENADNNGISHFIEHMLFKGTNTRSAERIVNEFENVGAQVNAYTGKELTAYYSISLKEHLEKCAELISDMLYNSVFEDTELKREKSVVCEEIDMCEDMPDDVCLQLLSKAYYQNGTLSKTILGSKENVNSFNRSEICDYMSEFYVPNRITIVVVGDVDSTEAKRLAEEYFSKKSKICDNFTQYGVANTKSTYLSKIKKTEQANFAFAFPSVSYREDSSAIDVLNNCLGGSMSSRLFQSVREKLGLAYSVYTSVSAYKNDGHFTIFVGSNPKNAELATKTVKEELNKIIAYGISETELLRAKETIKTEHALLLEKSQSLMSLYGKSIILTGKPYDIEDKMHRINSVTIDDVRNVAKQVFDFDKVCAAYVGPIEKQNLLEIIKQ